MKTFKEWLIDNQDEAQEQTGLSGDDLYDKCEARYIDLYSSWVDYEYEKVKR